MSGGGFNSKWKSLLSPGALQKNYCVIKTICIPTSAISKNSMIKGRSEENLTENLLLIPELKTRILEINTNSKKKVKFSPLLEIWRFVPMYSMI